MPASHQPALPPAPELARRARISALSMCANTGVYADMAHTGTCSIVPIEEHTVLGGFGSAVLAGFALNVWRTAIMPLGLDDAPTHINGDQEWIRQRAGLATDHVRSTITTFTKVNS